MPSNRPVRHSVRRWLVAGLATLAATLGLGIAPAHAALSLGNVPDSGWRVNGIVYAETIIGNTLYVGGDFDTAISPSGDRVSRGNLAAFSMSNGDLVTGFRADTNDKVRALVTNGDDLWVGGSFTTIGGASHKHIARISSGGTVNSAFTASVNSEVRALVLVGNRLYAGGTFNSANGYARGHAALFAPASGQLSADWAPNANGNVYALAASPTSNVIYVGGAFSRLAGYARSSMGATNSMTGQLLTTTFANANKNVFSLSVHTDGSTVYAGIGGNINSLFAWNASTGARKWRVTADGDVQSVLFYYGYVYMGFHDGYQGNTATKLLAVNATSGAVSSSFRPTFDYFFGIYSLAASPTGLAAGGQFTNVSGVSAQGFVRWLAQ